MAIQIGKYKRPGIFTEEYDNSPITSSTVDGIKTMVIGFSKKGPVNTPVLLQNTSDLDSIFGSIDRNIERKGSFFHRTISKMLESSPVYAINLLATDDTLDVIEYKSLSTSSDKSNDITREGSYRKFFNTTGFWKRDTDSFTNLTRNDEGHVDRLIRFTNMSDKYITAFIFKSKVSGFNRTMIEWYGSIEKLPAYLNSNDYASDYMVDVLVVGGDWSNYTQLSVDPRWSAYFTTSGLRKEKVRDFANDRNINLLAYYEGLSLIPYFRDGNDRNIFIETTINRDTNKTGLFCAFNSDLFETDYANGKVDLIGNNLVGNESTEINFLSYNETIVESVSFNNTLLDSAGNVISINGLTSSSAPNGYRTSQPDSRTAFFAEGYVNGVNKSSVQSTTASIITTYAVSSSSYGIIGGKEVSIDQGNKTFTILPSSYPVSGATVSYVSTFVLDNTGVITKVDNLSNSSTPAVRSSDIVLGYVQFTVKNGIMGTASTFTDVTINNTGYKEMVKGQYNDYNITDLGNGSMKIEFIDTASTPSFSNYAQFRRIKMFNTMINSLDSVNRYKMTMVINLDTLKKVSMNNMTITNIVSTTTANKSFVLNTNLDSSDIEDVINGGLLFYVVDNELIISEYSMTTKDDIAVMNSATASFNDGVVAMYSDFYQKYTTGVINTGDYFYANLLPSKTNISFENVTSGQYAGKDYIIFNNTTDPISLIINDVIMIPSSTSNKGTFTILEQVSPSILGYNNTNNYAYRVSENTTSETLLDVTIMYNYLKKHYLKMYLNNDDYLHVQFVDELLSSSEPVDLDLNQVFKVQSDKSNFKQSLEIEIPVGYVQVPNKVLVNGSRYTEVKVGDFLESYYDVDELEDGEVPRKLTRILSKRLYAGDTTLVEITCDSRIATYNFNGDYQTFRYTSIEDYISTYKAISLKGFRVRQSSIPDGTEQRQNEILNLVASGTPLFKALANKEAIDFRYVIDAFGLGLTERSKQQLVDLCGARLDCMGFINMPSMKQFKNSTSPTFVNAEGVLLSEYIASGGDPESNPAYLYSFAEGVGNTSVGYFMPYVTVNDNGRPFDVPPAMYVATTYLRKHNSKVTSIVPWTIAAGVVNGKITGIAGLEMDYTNEDIEFLNQAKMNPIVYKRNRGYVIETENTAQYLYKSALSFLHVREVLIELERELSRMLLDFQWKFNTPEVRAEIKLRADNICEKYRSKDGLYNYFNKCDGENNTSEYIDNQIGVLDTYVEPIKGLEIIVNNVTVLRTGAIKSGGFITQ